LSIYDRLATRGTPVHLAPDSTSYFSDPTEDLDPFLFQGDHLRPQVRQGINSLVLSFLSQYWSDPTAWSTVWLAGSGVSHQWSAARDPGDLDCLVGVDMVAFRRANRDDAQLSDHEIASMLNSHFRTCLAPLQHDWNGYDLTVYVNENAKDIRSINPYAAYNVSTDAWDVRPDPHPHAPDNPEWNKGFQTDTDSAAKISQRYDAALEQVHGVSNPGLRLNASITLRTASEEAVRLFDEIHEGRHQAFAPGGLGYGDRANARWQASKASGASQALKQIKDDVAAATRDEQGSLYGGALATPEELIISNAMNRRYRG
jgi:hypothetical protein